MTFMPGNAVLTSRKTGSDFTLKDFRGQAVHKSYSIFGNSTLSASSSSRADYGEATEFQAQERRNQLGCVLLKEIFSLT